MSAEIFHLRSSILHKTTAMIVTSSINFFNASLPGPIKKPYQLKFEGPNGFPATNIETKEHTQKFVDVRGSEASYSIARHGFAIMRLGQNMTPADYDDDDQVHGVYLKQVADGLKEMLGASRVQIFEHIVRRHLQYIHLGLRCLLISRSATEAARRISCGHRRTVQLQPAHECGSHR